MFTAFPLILAFTLTVLFVPIAAHMARKFEIVDTPTPRKIHSRPTPLLGGTAMYAALMCSSVLMWSLGYFQGSKISTAQLVAVACGGLILMIGGYLDDRYNLKPSQQIIFPALASITTVLAGIHIQFVTNPFGGILVFPLLLGSIISFFWLLGMMYTTKFLDGLDGLVAGITVIASLIIYGVSLSWDVPESATASLALLLAGAAFGFLLFNWHPAKIFLGEGGSVFCGFMLGVLSIISGSKIATALLIMGVPILDVFWVIIRRLWQWQSPAHADQKHLHFRLLEIGLSHQHTVLLLYIITLAFGLTSLFLHSLGKIVALGTLLGFMIVLIFSLVILYEKRTK